ncbi:hypothetical protein UlMin_003718 [Ulmus minor]
MDSMLKMEVGEEGGVSQLEGVEVSVGEKRKEGELEAPVKKKGRIESGKSGVLKRVAEIVLVLSSMGKMRGGKKPTEVEIGLMKEAREKLVEVCEGLAPKDIVGREEIGAVIEDLGLNGQAKDQRSGFRGPRLTIAEKFSQTKKKMEETRKYVAQSTAFASHPMQTSFSTQRMIPSDKQSHPPSSSVNISATLPQAHVSTATPTSVQYQLSTNDMRAPMVSSGFPNSNLGRDSTSLGLPRVEKAQFKLEGGPHGSSYALQGQVSSSINHQAVNTPIWSVQTQAAKPGPEQSKLLNHTTVTVDGTTEMNMSRANPLAPRDQSLRPFSTQVASGNSQSMPQQLHSANYVQPPSLSNGHNEIAKLVQKLLQPKRPDYPTWIPPSRDYMNKALTCQICQLTINEVNSVLICDNCEKGYHTTCAQSFNQRGIPRGEWHCARCLSGSNGKPLPPKYGRVMRSNTKIPTAGVQSSPEKKIGTLDSKVNQQKLTANGISDLQNPIHTDGVAVGSNFDSVMESNTLTSREIQKNNFTLSSKNMDEKILVGSCASASQAVGLSESSSQQGKNSELSKVEEKCLELNPLPNKADDDQPSYNSQVIDLSGQLNYAEVSVQKFLDNNTILKEPEKSHLKESSDCNLRCDIKGDEQEVAQTNTSGCSATANMEHSGNSLDGFRGIEWIGNVIQVVDEKTFYQTCSIDGVTYKLQDHALFQSSHGKLTPSKLQSMWEDSKSGSKWVIVSRCYFPGDLPENVGRPCSPESNEVYESNHESTVMAGLIQGPCEVLPPTKFKEESERRSQTGIEPNSGLRPLFVCKWLYDEFKGSFQPVTG